MINCILTIFVHNYYAQPIYYTDVSKCCESLINWGIPLNVDWPSMNWYWTSTALWTRERCELKRERQSATPSQRTARGQYGLSFSVKLSQSGECYAAAKWLNASRSFHLRRRMLESSDCLLAWVSTFRLRHVGYTALHRNRHRCYKPDSEIYT